MRRRADSQVNLQVSYDSTLRDAGGGWVDVYVPGTEGAGYLDFERDFPGRVAIYTEDPEGADAVWRMMEANCVGRGCLLRKK